MNRKSTAALVPTQDNETTEELIGILTSISVVSKRMAKKLTLLNQQSAGKVGETNAKRRVMPAHAD